MNDTETKALIERLRLRRSNSHMLLTDPPFPAPDADCQAAADMLEQLLTIAQESNDFHQEVSDAVVEYFGPKDLDVILAGHLLERFIIPTPKPDPLEEVLYGMWFSDPKEDAKALRAALEARGLEIREKNDDRT